MAKKLFHNEKTELVTSTGKKGIPLFIKIGSLVLVLLVIAAAGVAAYQYFSFQQKVKADVSLSTEPKALVAEVGKLMELPLNEEPTIATVSDVEKLKDQPFFVSAQNGDKVLIYQKAKKAILYRPASKKIIDVGPVNIDPSQTASASAQVSGAPLVSDTVEVSLYNGTKRSGLTRTAEAELKKSYTQASVVEKENAENDYKETVVIDISGKNKVQAQALAKLVGGKVVSFPKGEATPSADILIILGDNYKAE